LSTSLDHIVHFVGNRSPSVTDTITSDGSAVNLTGSTVKLQMRPVGSATLKVDSAATIDSAPAGTIHYDWAGVDVDTAGFYVAWWRVTLPGGTIQDTPEFLVEIRPHAPVSNAYVSTAELKSTLAIKEQFADADIRLAIEAASRAVDGYCRQQFFLGPAAETRTYTPVSSDYLMIDPAVTITTVTVQGNAITLGTNFAKQLANAALDGRPWDTIRSLNGYVFPRGTADSVTVLGQFGWATVPIAVKQATSIIASRYLRRSREATFGLVGFGVDGGYATIPATDPDLRMLLMPYCRNGMVE